MRPAWGPPDVPHVGPLNLAIRDALDVMLVYESHFVKQVSDGGINKSNISSNTCMCIRRICLYLLDVPRDAGEIAQGVYV